jgi:hypothetical protein
MVMDEFFTHATLIREWVGVEVTAASAYLGYATGPGKGDSSWQKANNKFRDRVCLWGSQHLGLQYAAMTYNVYAVSVLMYVAQLEEPHIALKNGAWLSLLLALATGHRATGHQPKIFGT